MKISHILSLGSLWVSGFVEAAPTMGSSSSNIVKRSDDGIESIDFEYVISSIKAINERYSIGAISSIQKRDDDEFIDQLMMEFHRHNLMDDFVDQLASAPHLHEALEDSVVDTIQSGLVDEPLLVNSLRASGRLGEFFDSVLNNDELNDELYYTAHDILQSSELHGDLAARHALDLTEPFLHTVYSDAMSPKRKRYFDEEEFIRSHGMSKRDLLSSIISIVKSISNSGLVQKIVHSIIGNQSLIQYSVSLFGKIFRSINWQKLFTAIKNSGLIQKLFLTILKLLAGLFTGSSISSIIKELFGGGSNSTHKSFLASLMSSGVEVGSGLYSSLNKSSSSGLLSDLSSTFKGPYSAPSGSTPLYNTPATATKGSPYSSSSSGGFLLSLFGAPKSSTSPAPSPSSSTSSGGFLLSLLGSLFKPKSSSNALSGSLNSGGFLSKLLGSLFSGKPSSSSSAPLSGSQSSGGFFSKLLGSLFGGKSPSTSSSSAPTYTPSSSTGSTSSSTPSGKGFLATLFDALFPKKSGSSSSSSSQSSTGATAAAGFSIGSLIDGLFHKSGSASTGSGSTTSPLASPSSAFGSAKQCCCSPNNIRQRAMKRALNAKLKRAVKRSLAAGDIELNEGLMNFFLK